MSELNKVVKDGKVAVLYAPVCDHGWYTRCSNTEQLLYDPTVVSWVLAGKPESMRPSIEVYVEIKYQDDGLRHNLRQLEVSWLPIGTLFRIDDSDGWEAVYVYNASDYHVA